MAKIPEPVIRTVERIASQHPNDILTAVEESVAEVKRLPDYKKYVNDLVRDAIQDQVYACRHASNVSMKKQNGEYGGQHKVNGASVAVERIYESHYNYRIAGKTLGEIIGNEIESLIETEQAIASGHKFNAALLCWVRSQGVSGDKKVKDVVSERKLAANFDRIRKEAQGGDGLAMAGG